jgi:hypothetical protein
MPTHAVFSKVGRIKEVVMNSACNFVSGQTPISYLPPFTRGKRFLIQPLQNPEGSTAQTRVLERKEFLCVLIQNFCAVRQLLVTAQVLQISRKVVVPAWNIGGVEKNWGAGVWSTGLSSEATQDDCCFVRTYSANAERQFCIGASPSSSESKQRIGV